MRNAAAIRLFRAAIEAGPAGGLTDAELLRRFATRAGAGAEEAFTALVERHGPMVLRTCRGILDDPNDAHDASQATFLILARKGRGLWVRDSLGPWLHKVAHRAAQAARAAAATRQRHEAVAAGSRPASGDGSGWPDRGGWEAVLHDELARLPDRYRVPLVLWSLEGLTQEEVSRRLGWPLGTVKSRLARGRAKLKERLVRRGVDGSEIRSGLAPPPVPVAWACATARAAVAFASRRTIAGVAPASSVILTQEVLRAMILAKWRWGIAAVVAGAGLAAGAAAWAGGGSAGLMPQQPASRAAAEPPDRPPADAAPQPGADAAGGFAESRRLAAADLAKFQGRWRAVRSQIDGRSPSDNAAGGDYTATYRGDLLTLEAGGRPRGSAIVSLDPGRTPKAINSWNLDGPRKDLIYPGIYEVDGDTMRVCFARPGKPRPTEFGSTAPGPGLIFYEYRRVGP